ncbi:hypothetical protein GCM10007939_23600 [Amylibacter marinus]|uniref:Peptidase M16 C-terminal domain-containing protein n=1 Tax=Amylibacter marinus TaxID=1475483 RepID=A0ABQ5VXC0_9RHOB|nr:insulinase family protein [Amylibacter marinus]GLQ36076.1 hypothetical protein GCM10007939_23600 [Amylibacter marinus]
MKLSLLTVLSVVVSLILGTTHSATAQQSSYPITILSGLDRGQASVSLVWNINFENAAQERALHVLLLTKLNAGSPALDASESQDFRTINSAEFLIGGSPNHLVLTLLAPHETFDQVVDHAAEKLANKEIDPKWLKRIARNFRPIPSSKVRRPENVEAELTNYILFGGDGGATPPLTDVHQIILQAPDQIILNSQEYSFGDVPTRLKDAFGPPTTENQALQPHQPNPLPAGLIYVSDPEASETLVFLANSQEFSTDTNQAAADVLYKYMGYGPGSEMFRIVRQEQRASYDPRSHFTQLGNRLVLSGLSATTEAEIWQDTHQVIEQIYRDARNGKSTAEGLENSKNSMLNALIGNLRREPNWLAARYLEQYPERPPEGAIQLGLLGASFDLEVEQLNQLAPEALKPIDQMLTIVMGGGTEPPAELRNGNFCQLEIGQPLSVCLDQLSD